MHRRGVLSLLCLAGTGGCLRLQGSSQGATTTGDGEPATSEPRDSAEETATDDSETESGITLSERWTDELVLETVLSVNQGFFVQGDEMVAKALPSGMEWTYETPGPNGNHATEAFAHNDGRAVFGISPDEGESEDPDSAAYFLAFNSATGERLWTYEMPKNGLYEYARGAAIVDDVAVLGGHLYGSAPDLDPLVVGVDVETGEQVWETHLSDVGARYLSGMAVYDGSVCVEMAYHGVAVLDPATGSVDRTVDSVRNSIDGGTVSVGTFFGDDDEEAAAYSLDDGSRQWSQPIDDRTWTQPAVDNTVAVFGTGAGSVYVFERASGEVRWEKPVNGTVNALTLTASHVWVADQNDGLTAFSRSDGTVRLRATEAVEDMAAHGDSLLVGDDATTLYTIE